VFAGRFLKTASGIGGVRAAGRREHGGVARLLEIDQLLNPLGKQLQFPCGLVQIDVRHVGRIRSARQAVIDPLQFVGDSPLLLPEMLNQQQGTGSIGKELGAVLNHAIIGCLNSRIVHKVGNVYAGRGVLRKRIAVNQRNGSRHA